MPIPPRHSGNCAVPIETNPWEIPKTTSERMRMPCAEQEGLMAPSLQHVRRVRQSTYDARPNTKRETTSSLAQRALLSSVPRDSFPDIRGAPRSCYDDAMVRRSCGVRLSPQRTQREKEDLEQLETAFCRLICFDVLNSRACGKESDATADDELNRLLLDARHLRLQDPIDKTVIRLLAALHLYGESKVSALRYAGMLTLDEIRTCCFHSVREDFDVTVTLLLYLLRAVDCAETGDLAEAAKLIRCAIAALPGGIAECPLGMLKFLADQLLRCSGHTSSGRHEALTLYEDIATRHAAALAKKDNRAKTITKHQRSASGVALLSTASSMTTLSNLSLIGNDCELSLRPSLLGTQGWIPKILQHILCFTPNDLVAVTTTAAALCVKKEPLQLMGAVSHLRTAYALQPQDPAVLLQLADLGFLQSIDDFEDFYVDALRLLLPPSDTARRLVTLDPALLKRSTALESTSLAVPEDDVLASLPTEFRKNLRLLVESFLVVARNSLRHEEFSVAEALLLDAACLTGLDDTAATTEEGYARPTIVRTSLPLKRLLLRLILKWALAVQDYKKIVVYGKVGNTFCSDDRLSQMYLSQCPPDFDVSALLGRALTYIGNFKEALLHLKVALAQYRDKQNTTTPCVPTKEPMLWGPHTSFLFSLDVDNQSFVWEPFVITHSATPRAQEATLVEALLHVAEHPTLEDLETQQECLKYLCSHDIRDVRLRYKLAVVLERQNKFQEAEATYVRVLKLDPRHTEACLRLGLLYSKKYGTHTVFHTSCLREDYTIAYDVLIRVEKACNGYVPYLELLGSAALHSKPAKVQESLNAWLAAVELRPSFSRGLYKIGLIYYRNLKDFISAKEYMRRVLQSLEASSPPAPQQQKQQKQPSSFGSLQAILPDTRPSRAQLQDLESFAAIVLAEILLFENDPSGAQHVLRKICGTRVGASRLALVSGRVKLLLGDFKGTLEVLKPIIDGCETPVAPELSEAYVLAAQAAERDGNLKQAEALARRGYALSPQSVTSLVTLAWITARTLPCDTLDEPLRLCIVAERMDPASPLPKLFCGYFYLLRRQMDEALHRLEVALDRLQYVWTYNVSGRCHCYRSYLPACRIYLLLYWHMSSRSSAVSTANTFPCVTPSAVFEHTDVMRDIAQDLPEFQQLYEACKTHITTRPLADVWMPFTEDVKAQLEHRICLHDSHWVYLAEILYSFAYSACRHKLYEPPPQQAIPTGVPLPPTPQPSPSQAQAPSKPQRRQAASYQVFRQGEILPNHSNGAPPDDKTYKPHPGAYIPIPNDPLFHPKPYKVSQPQQRSSTPPPPPSQACYNYSVVKPDHVKVILNPGPTPALSVQSLSFANTPRGDSRKSSPHQSPRTAAPLSSTKMPSYSPPRSTPPPSSPFLAPRITTTLECRSLHAKHELAKSPIAPRDASSSRCLQTKAELQHKQEQNTSRLHKKSHASPAPTVAKRLEAIGIPRDKIFKLSDFTLGKRLGEGGFGAVYAGVCNATGHRVALKKLYMDLTRLKQNQWYDMLSEIQAMFYLRHPSLIEFMGLCVHGTDVYILTELCRRGSLHHRLHTQSSEQLPRVWAIRHRIALQLIQGVIFLHSRTPKVVHRDLKSLNVVLDENWNAKICDFGLTTSMDGVKTHISLAAGANGGSPRYMAPECYQSSGHVSEKVDIWSLGCILIEIFGGPLPYHHCKGVEQIVKALLVDRKAPDIPGHFPEALRQTIRGCLQFNPSARPDAMKVYQQICSLQKFSMYPSDILH